MGKLDTCDLTPPFTQEVCAGGSDMSAVECCFPRVSLLVGMFLAGSVSVLAAGAGPAGGERPRPLSGQASAADRETANRADLLRADYEAKYLRPDAKPQGESLAFQQVEAAYRDALTKCKGTELEPYVWFRLAGLLGCRSDEAEATELQKAAKELAGTVDEMRAHYYLGLLHLQRRNEPGTAALWLKKVVRPGPEAGKRTLAASELREAHKLYISAQEQLARCEARLGDAPAAKQRYDRLIQQYPEHRAQLADALAWTLREAEAYRSKGAGPPKGTERSLPAPPSERPSSP